MRTIKDFEYYVQRVHEFSYETFLPQIFDQKEPLSDELCEFGTLMAAQYGLGVPNLKFEVSQQNAASKLFTVKHTDSYICRREKIQQCEQSSEDLERIQEATKNEFVKSGMISTGAFLSPDVFMLGDAIKKFKRQVLS